MRENFAPSLKRVLVHEGGYVNHPKDPGGETNFGVTKAVYDGYRRARGLPVQSVRHISQAEVQEIYRVLYADKIWFDKLPKGVDYVVLDGAVNSGVGQSVKWLQRALKCTNVDGNIGPATISRLMSVQDDDALIADILSYRLGMLQNLKTWPTFGKGWRIRVADVLRGGQAWATGSVPTPAEARAAAQGGAARATREDAATPVAPEAAAPVATASGATGGLLETARQQVEPLAWSGGEVIQYILIGLTALTIAIAIGAAIYGWWANRKIKKVNAAMNADYYADVFALDEVQSA